MSVAPPALRAHFSYTNDLPVYAAIDDGVFGFPGTLWQTCRPN